MSGEPDDHVAPEPPPPERPRLEREVDEAFSELGRLATGVVAHLVGPKAVGRGEEVVASGSPVLDEAMDRVGDSLGKILHAVGDGLQQHPLTPDKAVKAAGQTLRDPAPPPRSPGWSALTTGIGSIARGIGKVGERVADELSGSRAAPPETPATPEPATPEPATPEPATPEPPLDAE